MRGFCKIIPTVTREDGMEVDSELFPKLLKLTGSRDAAKSLYAKARVLTKRGLVTELDRNGEPTLDAILKMKGSERYIDTEKVYGMVDKAMGIEDFATTNHSDAVAKAEEVNSQLSDSMVAEVAEVAPNSFTVKTRPRTPGIVQEQTMHKETSELRNKIVSKLGSWGIAVGEISEAERQMGLNGITVFDRPKRLANGLVEMIRIAKGEQGNVALAEEFCHLGFKALINQNNALAQRTLALFQDRNLQREVLGNMYTTYFESYEGDNARMAEEAVGKAMKNYILRGEAIPKKIPLLQRIVNAIKEFFASKDETELTKIINEANQSVKRLADTLDNSNVEFDVDTIIKNGDKELYSIAETAEDSINAARKMIDIERKKLALERKTLADNKGARVDYKPLLDAEDAIAAGLVTTGIGTLIKNSVVTLNIVQSAVKKFDAKDISVQEKLTRLRQLRYEIQACKEQLELADESLLSDKNPNFAEIKGAITKLRQRTVEALTMYQNYRKMYLRDWFTQVLPETFENKFGDPDIKTKTIDELMEFAEQDISITDRWFDSLGESSNVLLQGIDQHIKRANDQARSETISFIERLKVLGRKMEKLGMKNTEWMYERDEKGKLTLSFKTKIDFTAYRKARKEFYKSLLKKYGSSPTGRARRQMDSERSDWYIMNTETNQFGIMMPKASLYANKEYEALSADQKAIMEEFIALKREVDDCYPPGTTRTDAIPIIHKDVLERAMDIRGARSGWGFVKNSFLDQFVEREGEYSNVDNTEEEEETTGDAELDEMLRESDGTLNQEIKMLVNFDGDTVRKLPIYYTKMDKRTTVDDVSTDAISSMALYAAKAFKHRQLRQELDALEEARSWIRERMKTGKKVGLRQVIEGTSAQNKPAEVSGRLSRISDKLDTTMTMQVYGQKEAQEYVGSISMGKVADTMNYVQAVFSLGGNMLSGLANVLTGTVMTTGEAIGGEFFGFKNLLRANAEFAKNIFHVLSEIGSRTQTSKLMLFMQKFNILQDFEKDLNEIDWKKKTRFGQLFSTNLLFAFQNIGEFCLQSTSGVAMAARDLVLNEVGEKISVYDAMEVKYYDENGNIVDEDRGYGATLQIRPGTKNLDGTEFTMRDIEKLSNKYKAVNQKMHGIYNDIDRCNAQHYALGRCGLMFRKFIKVSMNKRYAAENYNADLGQHTEGFYRTGLRFLKRLTDELRTGHFAMENVMNQFKNPEQKANLRRALAEITMFLALCMLVGIDDDDKRKNKSMGEIMAEYSTRRLYSEVGLMSISPYHVAKETYTISTNPFSQTELLKRILNVCSLLWPGNWNEKIPQGEKHAGKLKSEQYIKDLLPIERIADQFDEDSMQRKTLFLKTGGF